MKTNQHSPVIMPHFSWSVRSPANAQKIQLDVACMGARVAPEGQAGLSGMAQPHDPSRPSGSGSSGWLTADICPLSL